MGEWIELWLAKVLVEIGLAVAFIFALVLVMFLGSLPRMWKQWRCKHERYFENGLSCDAICRDCRKNLGFIGTWREKNKKGEL